MIIQAAKSQSIAINMVWGTRGPGTFGIYISHEFLSGKQIQFSQMIIQAAGSQSIMINVVWGTRGPGVFRICNFFCLLN